MSRINAIQKAIQSLDGGGYQKLMDAYLYKKFKYNNIEPLGSHTGTNKVTKGIPDSYVKTDSGKYILIMYGTVESISYEKIKKDIESCLDKKKLDIEITQIEEIICCYTSTNIHIEQKQQLENMIEGIEIILLGIGTVSHDLLINYPTIASEFLNIPIDTEQIYEVDEFIYKYDKNGMSASINMELLHRKDELASLISKIENSNIVMVSGKSGVGKTRLTLEVCRTYKSKYNVKVYCIKNNGQMLYNDLKYYISDYGNYLLFIDDANQTTQLENVLDYIISPSQGISVKVILTVRDYAKDRVKKIIYNKMLPQEEEIKVLSDENIKDILNNSLGIKNDIYLKQIIKIAKGNARLAVLAGKIARQQGVLAIHNSTDIFKYYYGSIIEKEFNNKERIIAAFIIKLFGPLEYKNNETAIKILRKNGIEENDFYLLCHELNDIEIADLYMNKAVKISDQSMGDYLLYYVLIEKKYITLKDILEDGFKFYKNKIIYALNTIGNIFNDKECFKYIKEQVNKVWSGIEDEREQFEYVKCFYRLNEEKSLVYIKNKINKMETENISLDNFNFKDKMNNISIKSELINILGGFKYSDNYEIALELAIYYFKKRPSEVMDLYFLFSDRLGYDTDSFEYDYEKELLNIHCLWEQSKEGKEENMTILLLHVIKNYMGFEFSKVESEGERSLNHVSFNLFVCEGLKKLRELMWEILSKLYTDKKYINTINIILLNYNIYGENQSEIRSIFESDLSFIRKYMLKYMVTPNFIQCKVLKHFKSLCKTSGIIVDEVLEKYKLNEDFLIYNTLVKNYEFSEGWEQEEKEREKYIYNMVKGYKKENFLNLFSICKNDLDNSKDREQWCLQQGISMMFNSIKENPSQYIMAIKAYLKSDVQCLWWIKDKISILIEYMEINETEKIIFDYEYINKNSWIYEFLFCIPKEAISTRYAKLLRNIFYEEIEKEQPLIPNVQFISIYQNIDESIVTDLSLKLLEKASDKPYIISPFLGNILNPDEANIIYSLFKGYTYTLEELYLVGVKNNVDFSGHLFIILVNNNFEFFKRFIRYILKYNRKDYQGEVFCKIWDNENYKRLIEIACETIIASEDSLYLVTYNSVIESLFIGSKKDTELVKSRKLEWINNYINNYYDDVDCLVFIFEILSSFFSYNRKEFMLYLLSKNKNIEVFKKIPLFPRLKSWSGSEVPLIEKEINFIKELMDGINGIDYLDHKVYLKEILTRKEKYKQDILVREYLEDMDIS